MIEPRDELDRERDEASSLHVATGCLVSAIVLQMIMIFVVLVVVVIAVRSR